GGAASGPRSNSHKKHNKARKQGLPVPTQVIARQGNWQGLPVPTQVIARQGNWQQGFRDGVQVDFWPLLPPQALFRHHVVTLLFLPLYTTLAGIRWPGDPPRWTFPSGWPILGSSSRTPPSATG